MTTTDNRAAQVLSRLEELGLISEEESCLTRTFGSPAMREANRLVGSWAEDAGFRVTTDAIGNLRIRSTGPSTRTLLLGSHLDTVRDAGRFDGPLGVVVALDSLLHHPTKDFEIELLGFCDEEGARFQTTYLGSKAVAGTFEADAWSARDDKGVTLRDATIAAGGDPDAIASCAISREGLLGYVEIHLEQGPVLEAAGEPLGIVTAISGQSRVAVEFIGRAAHAGATPMTLRRDALVGASEFILAVEGVARLQGGVLATVGTVAVPHGAGNVVPGRAELTLDVRSTADATRRVALETMHRLAQGIATRRSLKLEWKVVQDTPAATCDPGLRGTLAEAVAATGNTPLELPSGAGHDAAAMIGGGIPAAMLFVRCRDGVSHHRDEFVAKADIAAALAALDAFLAAMS